MSSVYVPAVGSTFIRDFLQGLTYKGFDLAWWIPNSFFRYPLALVSYANKGTYWWRRKCNYPQDHVLIGDSGGFSLGKKTISPRASLHWQEQNCDVIMNLDVPLGTRQSVSACRMESVENFSIFEKERQNSNTPIYNVLHGGTPSQIKTWYDAVKVFDFQGWAIGIKANPKIQVFGYLYLNENDPKGAPMFICSDAPACRL